MAYDRILKKAAPCKCGGKAEWGAGYLICNKCQWESDTNWPPGKALRSWNKRNKKLDRKINN